MEETENSCSEMSLESLMEKLNGVEIKDGIVFQLGRKEYFVQSSEEFYKLARAAELWELVPGAVHDFKNYMAPVISYGDLLLDILPKDSPLREKIIGMMNAAYRAEKLAQSIMSFSGKKEPKESVDLREIIEDAFNFLGTMEPKIPSKNLNNLVKTGTYIYGNAGELGDVVLNLGKNAKQAIYNRGYRKGDYLKAEIIGKESDCTCLAISDTGPGIPREIQEKIFEPWFTTKEKEGKGLGLARVQKIIEDHKGRIELESEVGKGTTFYIYLPTKKID